MPKTLCDHIFSSFLANYLRAKFVGSVVIACLIFKEVNKPFQSDYSILPSHQQKMRVIVTHIFTNIFSQFCFSFIVNFSHSYRVCSGIIMILICITKMLTMLHILHCKKLYSHLLPILHWVVYLVTNGL